MECPDCGGDALVLDVPADLREHAPDGAARVAFCPDCFSLTAAPGADASAEPAFERLGPRAPTGRAGVAFALLCGHLDSLALHRSRVEVLVAAVEDAGGDPLLALDRLVAAGVDPGFDLQRRRTQLSELL